MPTSATKEPTRMQVFQGMEKLQREGWNFTTFCGYYRQAYGNYSNRELRLLWRLAKVNPFRFRGLA